VPLVSLQGSTHARGRRRPCRWTLMWARRSASAPSPQGVGHAFYGHCCIKLMMHRKQVFVCVTAAHVACQPGAASCCLVLGGSHCRQDRTVQRAAAAAGGACVQALLHMVQFCICPLRRPLPECPGALVPRRAAALLAGAAAPARGRSQGQVRGSVLRQRHRPGRLLQGALPAACASRSAT
jgi:hypothetical protein